MNYYNTEFNRCKKDITKTWKIIAELVNKSKSEHKFPTYIDVNNVKIKDNQEIANHFNNFFINCAPNLANKIDTSGKPEFKSYLDGNNVDT